jgi:hypothetical protein
MRLRAERILPNLDDIRLVRRRAQSPRSESDRLLIADFQYLENAWSALILLSRAFAASQRIQLVPRH